MNPSEGHTQRDANRNDGQSTPSEPLPRPQLVRSLPERLSEISRSPTRRRNSQSKKDTRNAADNVHVDTSKRPSGAPRSRSNKEQKSGGDEEQLAKLKEAMQAKLLQQNKRKSLTFTKSDNTSPRVTAIQEEEGATSARSIDETLARRASHESTESANTIRANKPVSSPGQIPLRTPSYPFPYVPTSPQTVLPRFHEPFTSLSPTTSGDPQWQSRHDTRFSVPNMLSGESTPAQHAFQPPHDPRFPTPDLYDMILQLNSEPGLDTWWSTVTTLMCDHFHADRATLVVPRDPSDIENVPWGQKATFDVNGPQDVAPQKLHRERLRPRLAARHSYAGHGRDAQEVSNQTRPTIRRTVTYTPKIGHGMGPNEVEDQRLSSSGVAGDASLTSQDFSGHPNVLNDEPYAEVLPTLRALDHELQPLIEHSGVNLVLDKARAVVVTRNYQPENANPNSSIDSAFTKVRNSENTSDATPRPSVAEGLENYSSAFVGYNPRSALQNYEEYEQHATSPWSQSPAPSPAVQADEKVNPFFASQEQQVEECFTPGPTVNDYSQLAQVEAIGVEYASTVIHVPLVHPTMSPTMPSLRTSQPSKNQSQTPRRSSTLDSQRKAPIAILSILCGHVPYPSNLEQSLKLLGPHLACSFATSQQISLAQPRAVNSRHRRTGTEQTIVDASMTKEPTSLDQVMGLGIGHRYSQGPGSGSITSPSEYSGQSPFSTSSSIVGTPGWDPATHGWTSSKSAAATPGGMGSEMVDSYFEAKKRSSKRHPSNGSDQAQPIPARSAKKTSGSDRKSSSHTLRLRASGDNKSLGGSREVTEDSAAKINQPNSPRPAQGTSPNLATSHETEDAIERRHSQLHSYGADVQTSFGGLPSTASGVPRTPGIGAHERKPSYSEDMPPPSERLLRTIIDSVPVQIWTAEPMTGEMTWINSKFIVYRKQEPRSILDDPWQAIHPEDRNEFLTTWSRSLRTAQQLQQKVRLQRFDGAYRWFYVRAAPLFDKSQKIVHWIGTMMDFHEQNLAQEKAAKQQETAASEAKYRALANSSPQIVFAATRSRGITFCNTQWTGFSGQSEASARGMGFMDHVHPDDLLKCKLPTFDDGSALPKNVPTSVPPELRRATSGSGSSSSSAETEKVVTSPQTPPVTAHMPQRKLSELAGTGILKFSRDQDGRPSYSTEVRLKSKDGEYRWHLVRVLLAEPLMQHDGEEETWYGTCTDISDHKALERDLKKTMDEKTRFLSNMSHEIRTPLNGITGMVNFLIDSSLTAEQMEHVNIIRASTEGLRGLINDILDLSKAEAGMIQLNLDWLHIRSLIEEVNDLTSTMAIDKGLELNYLVETDVPTQIKGDRFRLRQILLNIIGNAIKFTKRGEVFVRCSVQPSEEYELAENEVYIKFDVIDTGRGFTNEEAEHLFKRFSQIDGSSTRQHGGSGLGLVISRQLAQLHGGDMRASGVLDEGATFTCLIKANIPDKLDRPPTPLPTPAATSIPILQGSADLSSVNSKPALAQSLSEGPLKSVPKYAVEQTQSPSVYGTSPDIGRESPSVSSVSSDPSIASTSRTSALQSHRSSASSFMADVQSTNPPMTLRLPSDTAPTQESKLSRSISADSPPVEASSRPSRGLLTSPDETTAPPMYSILVVCPLKYSRQATIQHINETLPKNVPHQITEKVHLSECQELIGGSDPVIFTHIVVVLHDIGEIVAIMDQILSSPPHQSTSIIVITDLAQRRQIMEQAPKYNYGDLLLHRRLRFVFKPLKPSRFATIFDPQKEREMSFDRNRDDAQQVALTQKQVFERLSKALGNQDKRVLLVEDNKTNQLVVLKFLAKVSIAAETAIDGVECTDRVFSKSHGYYSMILCDLHMPNKDGYQTCREIRKWERDNGYPHLPIIALSANVLGDVQEKCVSSGFNSYLTKPVDFKELSTVLMTFMDPVDPSRPHEFMKMKRRRSAAVGR